jgi:NAD(P)-dependent dehydrogenase (short-subunit alcohol dehydrogenase family)
MSELHSHELRVAITGGTSGLGLALVHALDQRGAAVAFVARHREGVERVLHGRPRVSGVVGDVSRKEDIHPIAIQVLGALGGLDVLVNNASSLGPVPLATNLVGPFRLTKALLGSLAVSAREGRRPLVVNVSSDAAVTAYPGWGAYGASKAALHQLSRIWSEELASEGIRVVSIDPGDMDTPLHALAVPDADRSTLKSPHAAAREIADLITGAERKTRVPFVLQAGEAVR